MLNITLREYQKKIAETCKKANTLVVLPTGLGKTLIAFEVMDYFKEGLFLAPTKPLAKQHMENFIKSSNWPADEVVLLTGEISRKKRVELYKKRFIFATPQTVRNDIRNGIALQKKVIVFDECHRAIGDYAYVEIAKSFGLSRIIGLTASPGGDKDRIKEVLNNLNIQAIELRTENDGDVKPYIKDKIIKWVYVSLNPPLRKLRKMLKEIGKKYEEQLTSKGIYLGKRKKDIIAAGDSLNNINHPMKYKLMVSYAAFLNINHMIELIETQGLNALSNYLAKALKEKKAGIKELLKNKEFQEFRKELQNALLNNVEHPKMEKLIEIVKSVKTNGIIFVQYRDQVFYIVKKLSEAGIKSLPFLGKKQGYSRKKQEEVIKRFRNREVQFLVSSSIGEEGIDIPSVDIVIFYEPVPSEIRAIQRRGRTGRFREGHIIILITKNTRDEWFYWAAIKKEKKMRAILNELKNELKPLMNEEDQKLEEDKGKKQMKLIEFF